MIVIVQAIINNKISESVRYYTHLHPLSNTFSALTMSVHVVYTNTNYWNEVALPSIFVNCSASYPKVLQLLNFKLFEEWLM